MPTISVDKAELYKALGKEYTKDEFDELCFEFGIELDEDTSETKRPIVDGVEEPPQLKIEIPANRYDMLCFEGIAMNLNVFLGRQPMPQYRLKAPANGQLQTVTVTEDTARIRPYFSCAILRNIKFTKSRYESFIALQDKLHQNLARQRTLVAIGTHDLDTIEGPFTYEAQPPEAIKFAPLNQTKEMTGKEMMEFYEKDKHLSRYLPIIRDSPVYPIIYDKNRQVLSMPPIINSNHSKITLNTKNVFIDITATDKTKLEIVNHIIISMFSQYCEEPFTIEPVNIVSPHNGESRTAPDVTPRKSQASAKFINSVCGLDESRESISDLLKKMCISAKPSTTDEDVIDVDIPITRADVLHQADIMEDVAIAYGFNSLPRQFPSTSSSVAAALPINKLSDIIRLESAMAGWAEVMPLTLCSHDENYAWLNKQDDNKAIRLQNPKTAEYQIVRTSLIPGLLKTIRENKRHAVPMKIFEVGDVCYKDATAERRSRNEKHFAACWYGKTSGFEQVHGLLDRVMMMLKAALITREDGLKDPKVQGYWIEELDESTYLPGHSAAIYLQIAGQKAKQIGSFGILHPTVLKHFELPFPTSTLEINAEVFL
ncbi:phenylalanine--trna ligase beta subunit [Acrodontium crateriforme]|uniref:Phenylalanine--tRNA ligase beta subunit n=1 Tax=Acrodontium crateriforme TaxID=150365 RepID=A0AAQ3LYN5_9PEZI|nr:phenylalanine--trna ligase beta subunit [Acrodontium crateriforme]